LAQVRPSFNRGCGARPMTEWDEERIGDHDGVPPSARRSVVAGRSEAAGLPRCIAPRGAPWAPETVTYTLPGDFCEGAACADIAGPVDLRALVLALDCGAEVTRAVAAERLCAELRQGGHGASEVACRHGAVEAAVALLDAGLQSVAGTAADGSLVARHATEALWLLIDDCNSCQSLIQCGGHNSVFRLARTHGPEDAGTACNAFRLLAQTLYGETRNAQVWCTADIDFVVDALGWALAREHDSPDAQGVLGFACDVAALWVLRAMGPGLEATKALVGLIPPLLETMSRRREDPVFLQHGCRLLGALARRCGQWPEDMRQPALAALGELSALLYCSPDPQIRAHGGSAFKAVAALPAPPPALPNGRGLNTMD